MAAGWAFGTGFAKAIQGNIDRSNDETSQMRRMMIQRYSSMADQYVEEKKKAQDVLKTERIYKTMGIPGSMASLAAYSGVTPDKLGDFMRQYEVVDNSNVRNRNDGQIIDASKLTGSAPPISPHSTPSTSSPQNVGSSSQGMPATPTQQSGTSANPNQGTPISSSTPSPGTGYNLSPNGPTNSGATTVPISTSESYRPISAGNNNGSLGDRFSNLISGRGNLSQASNSAVRDLAHVYGVSEDEFRQMASGMGFQGYMPDVSGITPRDPLDLIREDYGVKADYYNNTHTGTSGLGHWNASEMNNVATIKAQKRLDDITEDDPDYTDSLTDKKGLLAKYKAEAMAEIYNVRQQGGNQLMAIMGDMAQGAAGNDSIALPSRPPVNAALDLPPPNESDKLIKGQVYKDPATGDTKTFDGWSSDGTPKWIE